MNKMTYLYLTITILAEVIGVGFLKETKEFTKFIPSLIVISCYGITLYFLSLVMRTMPVSTAYAVWAAFGIIFVVIVGVVFYKEPVDAPAIIGTAFIAVGLVVINMYSKVLHQNR